MRMSFRPNVFAFNNACPHLHFPFGDSDVTEEGVLICKWHQSCFDLFTGGIKSWCPGLEPDGTMKDVRHPELHPDGVIRDVRLKLFGNVSKNRTPLTVFPARVNEGGGEERRSQQKEERHARTEPIARYWHDTNPRRVRARNAVYQETASVCWDCMVGDARIKPATPPPSLRIGHIPGIEEMRLRTGAAQQATRTSSAESEYACVERTLEKTPRQGFLHCTVADIAGDNFAPSLNAALAAS